MQQWLIPSSKKDGKEHKVTLYDDDTFACSCDAWIYGRKQCRHIKRATLCLEYPELRDVELKMVNGQVKEVTLKGKKAVIPLVSSPIDPSALMTFIHDLLELGISMKRIKKFFKGNSVSKLNNSDVYEWIDTNGRVKVKPLKILTAFF